MISLQCPFFIFQKYEISKSSQRNENKLMSNFIISQPAFEATVSQLHSQQRGVSPIEPSSKWLFITPNNIRIRNSNSSQPFITVRDITQHSFSQSVSSSENLQHNVSFSMKISSETFNSANLLYIQKYLADYHFNIVDHFCLDSKICLVLTLQQESISSQDYVSRLGSFCLKTIFPYVEILLTNSNEKYSRGLGMTIATISKTKVKRSLIPDSSEHEVYLVVILGSPKRLDSIEAEERDGFSIGLIKVDDLVAKYNGEIQLCASTLVDSREKYKMVQVPDWYTNTSYCSTSATYYQVSYFTGISCLYYKK